MNYYEELGVEKDVTLGGIKRAYRRLAKKYHPDKNPDDDQAAKRFVRIAAAYETLSDEEKRKEYDEGLNVTKGSWRSRNQAPHKQKVDPMNMSSEFENFFGFTPDGKKVQNSTMQANSNANPIDTSQMFEKFFQKAKVRK